MVSYRKRVKVAPGINLNISKSGVSSSFGPRGAKINIGPRGTYVTTGIPGTGIYSRQKISGKSASHSSTYYAQPPREIPIRSKAENNLWGGILLVMTIAIAIIAIYIYVNAPGYGTYRGVSGMTIFGIFLFACIGLFTLIGSLIFFSAKSIEDYERENELRAKMNEELEELGKRLDEAEALLEEKKNLQ